MDRVRAVAIVVGLAGSIAACSSATPDALTGATATGSSEPRSELDPPDGAPSGQSGNTTEDGVCWSHEPQAGEGIRFDDTTSNDGLVEPLTGMYGHTTAIADVNGDGWTDVFVAGFADRPVEDYRVRGADGPSPDRLLLGGPAGFRVDSGFVGDLARTSGATFADLDNDGDLDLVVVRNPREGDDISERPTTVYRNSGGTWTVATELAPEVSGRSVAAFDADHDGSVDLTIAGDRFGNGPTRFYRNDGDFNFVDTTSVWGIPDDMFGLSLATADLDDDGWLDVVVSGDERVLLGGEEGFEVVTEPMLVWELFGEEDDPAGIAVGDLDRDGRPDLVIGQHFNSTIDDGQSVPVRVFLNRTDQNGVRFVDATDESGVPGLWTKSPHVAVADVDNDGYLDIVTSAAGADGMPFVLRNTGRDELGFEPVNETGDGSYWVTGATDDFNHDGRLDVFMVAWEPGVESKLFTNLSESGHWLKAGAGGDTSDPVGARVEVQDPATGEDLAIGWVDSTTGYASGAAASVHVGLGSFNGDTVEVLLVPVVGEPISRTIEVDSAVEMFAC